MNEEERKKRMEALLAAGMLPKKPRAPRKKPVPPAAGNVIHIDSKGSVVGQVAGGDIHNHINERPIVRNNIVRGPEFISSAGARKIKSRIDTLVKMDVAAGMGQAEAYGKRWSMLRNQFNVPSYFEIRADQEQEAIDWLQRMKVLSRPSIRRTNNPMWRNDLYSGIYARMNETGRSKADVLQVVYERFGKRVVSLKSLGERNLKSLNGFILRNWKA